MSDKTSHLKLVKSFKEEDYPYTLEICFAYNPEQDPTDRFFRFIEDYKDEKIKPLQELFAAQIRQTMKGCPADDFFINFTESSLIAGFKHPKDYEYAKEDMGYSEVVDTDIIENPSTSEQHTPPSAEKTLSAPRLTRDDFKIVSDFSFEEYPYRFQEKFEYPHDGQCRLTTIHPVQAAVNSARIDDYKLLETFDAIELHLKTSEDSLLFQMAIQADREIEHEFIQVEEDYDIRRLKRDCTDLKKFAKNMGFGHDITFKVDRPERRILLFASGKSPYFQFCQVARQTGLMLKYAHAQRKKPEFTP